VVELARTGSPAPTLEGDEGDEADHAERYDVESLPRGTQLGRYVLLGRVSGRSSEVVYGAYDPDGDRKVGIKLFHPGGEEAQATRLRLVQQAQALAKLAHPCVERIYEAGTYGPWVFLATEFVDGLDLRQWMEARDEPFPWPEVLRVFREAGRGLAAAHKLGIVHRDFRPGNVILGKEGRLVVVDFGLAQAVEDEDDDIDISELRESMEGKPPAEDTQATTSGVAGTPAYMAPEQHLSGRADARSDQFSFCVALYEALYGERPFSGNRPRALALAAAKHAVRPPPAGSSVPPWLRTVLLKGLAPHPEERFPSMEALLRELARDPVARRRRWGWGAALGVGLLVSGGLVAMQLEADRSVCAGEGDALTEVWTPERRDALRDAFERTGRPWAEATWRYTEARLDTWADEWLDLSERACLSTRVWGDSGERTYELRQACLRHHLDGMRATLEAFDAIDGPALDRAHVLAQGLTPPRQCTDTNTLLTLGLPLEDQRENVDALHGELAGLDARLALGQATAVLRETQALQGRAEATDDAPLIARNLLLLGRARLAAGEPEAEAELHLAARAALEAGHVQLAAEAWLARMEALRRAGRATEAVALGDYVEGVLVHKRFGWLRPALDSARGDAERSRERPAEALACYHAALEHERARPDPDPLRMLSAWQGQAEIHVARGNLEEAAAPLETALDTVRGALGPLHPAAIDVLLRLGQVQWRRGQPVKARAHLEQALELVRESGLHDAARAAELEATLGSLHAEQGDHDRARAHLERAYLARGGAATAERAEAFVLGLELAREHRDAGDAGRAREVLEPLLAAVRDVPLAIDAPLRDGDPPSAADRIAAELLHATLVWDAGEHDAARSFVAEASGRSGDAPAHQGLRDELARWLEEHPLP
jgi:tRNA A-37 threonylcarbamoyl transferase component Bud32/tetratricopeptide (TPR) repeat protein